ncbi:MAG: methyl-accepting chemotaxis protein, partial [Oscillospiraceae bacterium]|nr:methyl-accepting chemotaxis protein [Oscillospiraceae bacterium]
MKNLKVRPKILLSFGIVIVLILAFSAFIVVTNLSINENAQMMRDKSQMQALCTKLVDRFSQANASISNITYSFDDSEVSNVMDRMAECQQTLEEMINFIILNPSLNNIMPDVENVGAKGEAWSSNVNEILTLNKELESIIEDSRRNKVILADNSTGIVNYQMELSRDEAAQDIDEEARLRRVSRVEQGADIATRLNNIANSFELMFEALDSSRSNENIAYFDETMEILTTFHDESALQYNIDTSAAMLEQLREYRKNLDDFLSCITRRDSLIQTGKVNSENALTAVNSLITLVEASSLSNADSTISMTSMALPVTIAIVFVMVLVSIFLALYLSDIISKPLTLLSGYMNRAGSTGDIELTPEDTENIRVLTQIKDEIGQTISGCVLFVHHVTKVAKELSIVASGDLSSQVEVLSDKDVLGLSIKRTVDNLNGIFREINSSSNQVSVGAKQVADGAQMLAQGSTEQAASIEELSGSITEIAERIKENATTADRASTLSMTIKDNAEKGSRQMNEMITAVSDINEASKNIGKIIKTIDDIAFQTNILALNAAVEAARAGQHGKGFAVVAEEVRNLASKSADAAKDTGGLIQDSMDKAELGVRIAGDTAASLTEIVNGINESSNLIAEITISSEEQSMGISQINVGIDQVAQVVQQNSATAEESAAASEEMSGQSDTMQQLIAQFRLQGGDTRRLESPNIDKHVRKSLGSSERPAYAFADSGDWDGAAGGGAAGGSVGGVGGFSGGGSG